MPPSRATATAVVAPAQVPGNPRDTSSGRTAADVITGTSTFRLQLPLAQGTRIVPEAAVETSAHRDLESVPLPQASATGLVTIRVPAASITTCVFKVAGEQ